MKYERESRPREMKRTHAISDMEILKMVENNNIDTILYVYICVYICIYEQLTK